MDNNRKPLALRYRPQKFQELIGQDSMVISIQNAIKLKRIKFNSDQMKFRIYDELSGIKSYEGRINNDWILFEYDNKNDVIISKKKNSIQSFKGKFVLEVIDNANNRRTLNLNL